jgi:hypothetical protein
MILTLSNTAPAYNGRIGGTIITSNGLRAVARSRSRPASRRQRQNWSPPFSLATSRTTWAELSPGEREAWDDYAAAFVTWPIEGSPRYASGRDSFANFYTVRLLLDPLATIPEPPLDGVTWQPRPKFFPFAEWELGMYTLKAETEFAENTNLMFSSVPPSPTVFNGQWFGEKIVGSELFYAGLFPNEDYSGLHDMIEAQFGSIDNSLKIWGRVWEVAEDGGSIRVLKDPCTVDPVTETEDATVYFTISNQAMMDAVSSSVEIYYLGGTQTDSVDIGTINAGAEGNGSITMGHAATLVDLDAVIWAIEWTDSSTDSLTEYGDGSSVYEWAPGGGPPPPP